MTLVAKWMAFSCFGLVLTGTAASAQSRALSCAVEVAPSDSGSGRIGDVAVGPGNRLAWTDGRPGQVMVRDAQARVRAIGRSGNGPGEVWLQRTHRFERAAIWQPIARDGKPGQQVNAAPLTRLLLVAADSAWGVRADEDGLESLLRCAVRPS